MYVVNMIDTMRLVITADTHVPKRAKDLPAPLWTAIEQADVVVHAGDWVDVALDRRARSATEAGAARPESAHRP